MIWACLVSVLAFLWVLDAVRLRRRAQALHVLSSSEQPVAPEHRFLCRPDFVLDPATRRAASAYVREQGLQVLVILPPHLPAPSALLTLQTIDPRRLRTDRVARGRCLGAAFVVHTDVLARMAKGATASEATASALSQLQAPTDAQAFADLAGEFKKYATTTLDIAVAPGLAGSWQEHFLPGNLLSFVFGSIAPPVLLLQLVVLCGALIWAPTAGLVALAILHLQAAAVLLGTPLRAAHLLGFTLLRLPCEMLTVLTSFLSPKAGQSAASVAAQRPVYAGLLAQGTTPFFEERRSDCPICASTQLRRAVASRDRIQNKPGTFTIDRCLDCQHLFQNPRLSIAGLEFYYRDFYDGLGQEQVDEVFGYGAEPYLDRARMLVGTTQPSRWLDVGAGHGHFCSIAREVWPEAAFDALDLSRSVEVAQERGWADKSYRGLFPDLADSLAHGHGEGRNTDDGGAHGSHARAPAYDVVSMSHYLEHTRDPAAEIAAAAKVLPSGGHLLIELPDPDCRLGRIFGSFWFPWFQPQHQHLLSTRNLERLLRLHAFEPVNWHRGEAHQPTDFFFSLVLFLNQIARPGGRAWQPEISAGQRLVQEAWHKGVFIACFPLLIGARVLDLVLAPLLRRPGWSNTYRVLARRLGPGEGGVIT